MSKPSVPLQILGLFVSLAVTFAAAGIGSIASVTAGPFYAQLDKPSWAPPPWLFGPMWTMLYLLMAIAAWLVWRERGFRSARLPLALFLIQLIINALWSWIFFAWHQGGSAFTEVALLWVLVLATLLAFWRRRPLAGMLLIPYLLWVTLATLLTYEVWCANPLLLG